MAEEDPDQNTATLPMVHHFEASLKELIDCVEAYRDRKFDEDLKYINEKFGRIEGLCKKIKSDIHDGICQDDFENRDEQYGNNKKPEPKQTGF